MNPLLLDTNIFINVLAEEEKFVEGSSKLLSSIAIGNHQRLTGVISITEILTRFFMKGEMTRGEQALQSILFFNNLEIMDYDLRTAIETAKIRGDLGIKMPDAIILVQQEFQKQFGDQ